MKVWWRHGIPRFSELDVAVSNNISNVVFQRFVSNDDFELVLVGERFDLFLNKMKGTGSPRSISAWNSWFWLSNFANTGSVRFWWTACLNLKDTNSGLKESCENVNWDNNQITLASILTLDDWVSCNGVEILELMLTLCSILSWCSYEIIRRRLPFCSFTERTPWIQTHKTTIERRSLALANIWSKIFNCYYLRA